MCDVIIKCLFDIDHTELTEGDKYTIEFDWDKCIGAITTDLRFDKIPESIEAIDYIKRFHRLKIPMVYNGKTNNKIGNYLIFTINIFDVERCLKLKDILDYKSHVSQ